MTNLTKKQSQVLAAIEAGTYGAGRAKDWATTAWLKDNGFIVADESYPFHLQLAGRR